MEDDETRKLQQYFFEKSPHAACWLDASGTLRLVNEAFERQLLRSPAEDWIGVNLAQSEKLKFLLRDPSWAQFMDWLQLRGAGSYPVTWSGPDTRLPLTVHALLYQSPHQTYVCLELADHNPPDNQQQFRQIVEDAPLAVYAVDAHNRVVVWNRQCEQITGYPATEVQAQPGALAWLHPDPTHLFAVFAQLRQATDYAEYKEEEREFTFQNGRKCVMSWVYRRNRTTLPEATVWAIGVDTTELNRAMDALRRSGERFRAISRATNDVLWDWDLRTDQVWWSHGMSSVFGHAENQISGHINWWVDNLHEDDRQRVFASIKAAIERKEETWREEYRFRRSDHSYAQVQDKGVLLLGADGQPERMIGGIVDLTETKLTLEKIQLRDKQLAEVSFYNSHKVRAPLARLLGLVEVVQMDADNLSSEQQQLLEKIKGAAHELDFLVKSINQIIY